METKPCKVQGCELPADWDVAVEISPGFFAHPIQSCQEHIGRLLSYGTRNLLAPRA